MRSTIIIVLFAVLVGCQTTGRGLVLTERVQVTPNSSVSIKMLNGRATVRTQTNGVGHSTHYLNSPKLIDLFRP